MLNTPRPSATHCSLEQLKNAQAEQEALVFAERMLATSNA